MNNSRKAKNSLLICSILLTLFACSKISDSVSINDQDIEEPIEKTNSIVFDVFIPTFTSNIFVTDTDSQNVINITGDLFTASNPQLLPEGKQVLFSSYQNQSTSLYVLDMDSMVKRKIYKLPNRIYELRLSPNGYHFAVSASDGSQADIFYGNIDGDPLFNISPHDSSDRYPEFSSDGNRLLFQSNREGNYEVYEVEINGKNLKNLTNHIADDYLPIYSPDENEILFGSRRDGNGEVYKMLIDGTEQQNLSKHPSHDVDGKFSPDGNNIVYCSWRNGRPDIVLANTDGTETQVLTDHPADDGSPSFFRDNSRIVFISGRFGGRGLVLLNLHTNEFTNLTESLIHGVINYHF